MIHTDTVDATAPIEQLKAISSWVSSVQDLDKLLQLIIESATNVVRAEAASLLLVDAKTGSLYFKVATGTKAPKSRNSGSKSERASPVMSPAPASPC